jgi:hypothetical protein
MTQIESSLRPFVNLRQNTSHMKNFRAIVSELTRRKVLRVLWIYLAVFAGFIAWCRTVFGEWFNFDNPIVLWGTVCGIAVIPLLVYLSWRYDIVAPHLVRDAKDVAAENPALGWAAMRHDAKDAGFVLLGWADEESRLNEKRFFQPVGIGRETGNDIELPDPRVSRHHAVLWAEGGTWRIRDLDSANGTFIDAVRVNGSAVLPQACELRFHPNGPAVTVCVTQSQVTVVG